MSDVSYEAVVQELRGYSASTVEHIHREMDLIGDMLVNRARELAPRRRGRLERSIHAETRDAGGQIELTIGTQGVPYAAAQEYGANISIPEYMGKVMKFIAKSGDLVFTRTRRAYVVTLPERSYIRKAVNESYAEVLSRLKDAVTRED